MRRLRKILHSAASVSAAFAALLPATAAHSQVIEVEDDGTTRTFSGPTRFVEGPVDQSDPVTATTPLATSEIDPFEQAAKSENVDVHLLRAVAWTESRGRANAVSPKGARGVMQLMPGTAVELGVDPLDAVSNITGGARYLARQLAHFNSVPLALAAYNAGPGAVQRWGGIPPYAETKAYVESIMSRWAMLAPSPAKPAVSLYSRRRPIPEETKNRQNVLLIEVPSL